MVKVDMTMSLDAYVAGPNATLEKPLGESGDRLHEWMVHLASFRRVHGLEGGEIGPGDDRFRASVEANGAVVMGRRMFSGGAGPWEDDPNASGWWGDEPPFGTPVFVVTHHEREPLALGETTFRFVTDGVESALEQARAAARERDVLVAGGAAVAGQALAAGLVDELHVHVAPLLLGAGVRLFDGLESRPELEVAGVAESRYATHLSYRVRR
jgi:dihydrofolate reductase